MRSIPLRPGETFVIGDTAVSAELAGSTSDDMAIPMSAAQPQHPNLIKHQSNEKWVADYVREERRLATSRVRIGAGDI